MLQTQDRSCQANVAAGSGQGSLNSQCSREHRLRGRAPLSSDPRPLAGCHRGFATLRRGSRWTLARPSEEVRWGRRRKEDKLAPFLPTAVQTPDSEPAKPESGRQEELTVRASAWSWPSFFSAMHIRTLLHDDSQLWFMLVHLL